MQHTLVADALTRNCSFQAACSFQPFWVGEAHRCAAAVAASADAIRTGAADGDDVTCEAAAVGTVEVGGGGMLDNDTASIVGLLQLATAQHQEEAFEGARYCSDCHRWPCSQSAWRRLH